jgi:hypothetical protein
VRGNLIEVFWRNGPEKVKEVVRVSHRMSRITTSNIPPLLRQRKLGVSIELAKALINLQIIRRF